MNNIFNENKRTYKKQNQRGRSNSDLSIAETVISNNSDIINEKSNKLRTNLNDLNIIKKIGKKVFVEEPEKVFHLIFSINKNQNNNYEIQFYSPIAKNKKDIRKITLTDDEAKNLKNLMAKDYYSKHQNNNIYKKVKKSRKNGSKQATRNITLTENAISWISDKFGRLVKKEKEINISDIKNPEINNATVEFSVGDKPNFGYKFDFQNNNTAQKFYDLIIAYQKPQNRYGHQQMLD